MVAVAAVVLLVSSPFRRSKAAAADAEAGETNTEAAELEAAKEAKYREIRDAELDHRTGKLSDEDFHAIDNALRAEAVEILRALDRANQGAG